MSETLGILALILIGLSTKFYVYSLYIARLNQWFNKTHNPYKISAIRIGVGLIGTILSTSLGVGSFSALLSENSNGSAAYIVGALFLLIFPAFSWYIIINHFYNPNSPKEIFIGWCISTVLAVVLGIIGFAFAIQNVNFC